MTRAESQPAPIARLLELHRGGRLVAEYPNVRGLLTEPAAGDDPAARTDLLAQAGRLLARLDPDDVVRAHPDQPTVSVAFTGHGTLGALPPALTAELARHGLLLRPHLTDFDSWVFELTDPASALYAIDPDLTCCVLDAEIITDQLPLPWRPEDVERVFAEKTALIDALAARHGATARGTLVLNTLPLPRRTAAQLVDHRSRARLGAVWREANARLLRLTENHPALVILDLDVLLADGTALAEPRMQAYAKAHFAPELLAAYAREVGHLARHLAGRTKKALVLDLDETVWGGVLGEDGADGIEVAGSPRGEAFRAFQRTARQLASQGVLLAAVSKNDPEPVADVLRDHPELTLRADDFVRVTANWRPKHENLRELAEDLGIGVDSFVFADDSPYEVGLVRTELPDVAVVALDGEPALHVVKLLRDGWFDSRDVTAEDRARTVRYREELDRRDFLDRFASLDDYLRELGVTVGLSAVTPADIPRISQITLRTNQFNLTTERLQVQDVRARVDDPAHLVLGIRSSDRFGDNGLVGAVFVHRDGDRAHIDNFLLSCRVFARGIENACLSALLTGLRDTGVTEVRATYRRSAKNGKVADFYPRSGFTSAEGDAAHPDAPASDSFRHDLRDIAEPPKHVTLTASLERPLA